MMMKQQYKIKAIVSGGGTGGHIFPAISIANELKVRNVDSEILFVGAEGKMEMEKVPNAGYEIIGLPVRGFQRRLSFKNLTFFFKLFVSLFKARAIIRKFKPDVVIGVGGFASGPLLYAANSKGIPTIIQEQNSYPGVTNKLLASKAKKICVAYDGMDRYFDKNRIVLTGNPVRQDLINLNDKKAEAYKHFGLLGNKKTILIVGGSLGARTINQSILKNVNKLVESDIQVIWQTGNLYFKNIEAEMAAVESKNIKIMPFISAMNLAFSIADLVISRAGASTISELCLVHSPSILVPSPNVAEDHQTKNAMSLVKDNAAMMVSDKDAEKQLVDEAINLINDEFRLNVYRENIAKLGITNSADKIVDEIYIAIKPKD